jgi:hypothetical protein
VRTEAEKDALLKMIISKQSIKNDNLIREQAKLIEALKLKCLNYERELQKDKAHDECKYLSYLIIFKIYIKIHVP